MITLETFKKEYLGHPVLKALLGLKVHDTMQKDKLPFLRLLLALVGIKWLIYLNKTQRKEQVAGLFHHFLAEK